MATALALRKLPRMSVVWRNTKVKPGNIGAKRKGLDWARAQNVCFHHLSIALHSMLILEEHPWGWGMGDGGLCGVGLNWFG